MASDLVVFANRAVGVIATTVLRHPHRTYVFAEHRLRLRVDPEVAADDMIARSHPLRRPDPSEIVGPLGYHRGDTEDVVVVKFNVGVDACTATRLGTGAHGLDQAALMKGAHGFQGGRQVLGCGNSLEEHIVLRDSWTLLYLNSYVLGIIDPATFVVKVEQCLDIMMCTQPKRWGIEVALYPQAVVPS